MILMMISGVLNRVQSHARWRAFHDDFFLNGLPWVSQIEKHVSLWFRNTSDPSTGGGGAALFKMSVLYFMRLL